MEFVIHSMGMPFNGDTINSKSLGGSESCAYYLARDLAARGHAVKVFTSSQEEGVWNGVTYVWCGHAHERAPLGERFCHYAENTPHDVLIIQRHPLGFHRDYASKVNIWQLHDLALYRTQAIVHGGLPRVDIVTTVSQWHKDQVSKVYTINPESIHVVPNGVDASLYSKARSASRPSEILKSIGSGFNMLYQSRPERGLLHLLHPQGIMQRLAKTHPEAHLYFCAYENVTAEMRPFYDHLYEMAGNLPNVTNLGALTKEDLAAVQSACDLMCYPTEFEEVSCITAMEAMHARLPLLTSRVGALPETCAKSGTILLDLNKDGHADEDKFVDQIGVLIDNMSDTDRSGPSIMAHLAEQQREASYRYTWGKAGDALLATVEERMKRSTTQQLIRHYIDHGDIIAARSLVPDALANDRIARAACGELDRMYAFATGDESDIISHYEKWEAVSAEQAGGGDVLAKSSMGVVNTSRFSGIAHFVSEAVSKFGAKRILEFGCSYGHIIIPLAKMFPQVQFVGVDFVPGSIEIAKRAATHEGVTNVEFHVGSYHDVGKLGHFDAVIAAEVIEHVVDYQSLLSALLGRVVDGGSFIATTPYGRWEWTGRSNFHKGREHLHHFSKADVQRIFADFTLEVMCAPSGKDATHSPIGSWVYRAIVFPDKRLGELDYSERTKGECPRETVSACLIVKDGEATLRKSLLSIIEFVDEIVIGVDSATSDGTASVIARLQAAYPNMPFATLSLDPVVETGFDFARNRTINAASGDWIMWMDADEECVGLDNLHRVLRPSPYNAYGIAQIHYSTNPPQVLTTDYPARLFRNRRGVKFYGLVHEHPEDSPGKAIEHTALLPDIKFVHYGYVDETTRRKRFTRNYPLLLKDVEKYPDRVLNKFLMLRDLAQGIGFEREIGVVTPEQVARAERGCEIFRELVKTGHTRMVVDALQFYSICVETMNIGFNANVTVSSSRPDVQGMAYSVNVKGRFQSREDYLALVNKLAEESTANYESPYA